MGEGGLMIEKDEEKAVSGPSSDSHVNRYLDFLFASDLGEIVSSEGSLLLSGSL